MRKKLSLLFHKTVKYAIKIAPTQKSQKHRNSLLKLLNETPKEDVPSD